MNLAMLLDMAAEAAPNRVVIGRQQDCITSRRLRAGALEAATLVLASRVNNVVHFGSNSNAVPLALLGAGLAGVPFVPVSYRATVGQLNEIAGRLAPCLVIADRDEAKRIDTFGFGTVITTEDFLESTIGGEAPSHGAIELPYVDPESVAVVLFTSGTSGPAKAAVLRHRHLAAYVISNNDFMSASESEAQLVSVPPYHIAGVMSVVTAVYGGRRLVYLPVFDAQSWVATAESECVTHAMIVPTMLARILAVLEEQPEALRSLRHLAYGGGRMPPDLVRKALKSLPNVGFVNAYGLTETSSTIALLTPEDHRLAVASPDEAVRRRLASVGRALPSVELVIRDPLGNVVPTGGLGEIWVRGEQVAGEYAPSRGTAASGGGVAGAWFCTRDAGRLDEDGYLYLDGRLDDVIVRGGENISPGEIEDVLAMHPAVAEAAVFGVPDEEWGEAIAAVVVLSRTATLPGGELVTVTELQEWVRNHLRSTRTPATIEFCDSLPYTETGKLLRRVLRDRPESWPRLKAQPPVP